MQGSINQPIQRGLGDVVLNICSDLSELQSKIRWMSANTTLINDV